MSRVLKVPKVMLCSVICRLEYSKKNPEYKKQDGWVETYRKLPEFYVFGKGKVFKDE